MKLTKKYKTENYEAVARERDLLLRALQVSLRGEIDWFLVGEPDDNGSYYRYGVSGLARADGGLFWTCFCCPSTGQKDSFDVAYLDDLASHKPIYGNLELAIAIERAEILRKRAA